ncbi:glycosyltransferase family 4 protein [Rhizobium sp. AQ_MP]|uniref:glycosyltransferase family 4 protein n=1 Tax=Rhizobium sp. AQ_MP TaxID=2761536 RepID=UPI00163A4DEB|nr:glycosyltransferase family 4 protein [Rhizobium sp. AQ_MP]MBC2775886.1 glycosyltransferase family 4 protein [Rhizobium sp. AQ_MP]
MRILSIVTQLESGGAQTVALQLHRAFLDRGHESKLIFLYEKDTAAFPRRDYESVLPHRVRSPVDSTRLLFKLWSSWQRYSPQVVIAHSHYSNNLAAMMKAVGLSGKLFPVHHNVYESYPRVSRLLDIVARRLRLYQREIAVSDAVSDSLRRDAPLADAVTILNGLKLAPSTMGRNAARVSFGLPEHGFLIGNIGRLAEQKNQGFLVDLLPEIDGAHVAILGEGHLRDALLERAERLGVANRLTLVGAVVHERVPDFLRALDVFAMPSLFEGLSIAMLEAFVAGVPFVGHDVRSIAAVTADSAGLVLPLDHHAWITALRRIRDDEEYARHMSNRQILRAGDFTLDAMTDRYLALLGVQS